MNTFKKWDKKSIEDWGSVMSDDAKAFYRAFKNYLKREFPDAELIGFKPNHYDFSGFICQDGKYIYISHDIDRGRGYVDFNAHDVMNGVLYRTAEGPRDYRGGHNNFCSIKDLGNAVRRLFDRMESSDIVQEAVNRILAGGVIREALKRPDRSENYKEMLQSLKDGEYDSFEEFMKEAGSLLKTDGLTVRHFRLLKDAAIKHFGKKFELKYKQRGIRNIQSIIMRGKTLEDALRNFLDWCMDNDETGIFFELSNADMDWVEKNPKVYRVKVPGYEECGIELEGFKEVNEF